MWKRFLAAVYFLRIKSSQWQIELFYNVRIYIRRVQILDDNDGHRSWRVFHSAQYQNVSPTSWFTVECFAFDQYTRQPLRRFILSVTDKF